MTLLLAKKIPASPGHLGNSICIEEWLSRQPRLSSWVFVRYTVWYGVVKVEYLLHDVPVTQACSNLICYTALWYCGCQKGGVSERGRHHCFSLKTQHQVPESAWTTWTEPLCSTISWQSFFWLRLTQAVWGCFLHLTVYNSHLDNNERQLQHFENVPREQGAFSQVQVAWGLGLGADGTMPEASA